MDEGAPETAAETAEERDRRLYIESLRSKWKVPLSQEQYAVIRSALLPVMRARAEREAAEAAADAGNEGQDTPPPQTTGHSEPAPFETPWMTVPDVCRYAHTNKNIVYRALQVGELRGHQHVAPRGTWRVHRDDVDLWLRGEVAGTKVSRIRPHGRGSRD